MITQLDLPGLKKFKSGKVREVFDLGDSLLVVATDRISAFDCILPTGIPDKGRVLNQLSAWWFGQTRPIVPNHLLSCAVKDLPPALEPFHGPLAGRFMLARKADALPVECVVRGYLAGSGWKEYQATGALGGVKLNPGLREADRLDQPVFTPAHKAESGHDENISFERMADQVGRPIAERMRAVSLELYSFAAAYALGRGAIVADTKFEFGLVNGKLMLIDEALTPDSSRFWPASGWAGGRPPPSFDKQYVRDYLDRLDWNKTPPAPPLPDEVIAKTRSKYLEAFRMLTGQELDPS